MPELFDLPSLLKIMGYGGLFAIVFAESGLLIGFFLPGDSLLFTAGFLASQGVFRIVPLSLVAFIGAVLGDSVGYAFGKKMGPRIFTREDSWLFHKDHLLRAEGFYQRHGGKTLVLARFMPVIRTFAPILAGVGSMTYAKFLSYNVLGGFLWGVGVSLLGYFLGRSIPDVDRYLLPIIVGIILVSIAPSAFHMLRHREDRARLWRFARNARNRLAGRQPLNNP
jgi:membrane-associated protein